MSAIQLAQIFGPLLFFIGVGILIHWEEMEDLYQDYLENLALMQITGFINFVVGGLLLQQYQLWSKSPFVLLTILGWIMVLKGISILLFPAAIRAMAEMIIDSKSMQYLGPVVIVVLGVTLSYAGFFMAG